MVAEGFEGGGPIGDAEVVIEEHLVGDDFIFVYFFIVKVLLCGARGTEMVRRLAAVIIDDITIVLYVSLNAIAATCVW